MEPELDAAGAEISALVALFQTDIPDQPGKQRTVDRSIALRPLRIRRRGRPAHFLQRFPQLRVHVAPFAHPRVGEKVVPAEAPQARFGLQLPQLEEREEIGALVGEARVALVGRGGALHRPLARVLHRERRRDHQQLLERAFGARCDQHAREARVERQLGELAPDVGELPCLIDGAQLSQQAITVGDRARPRRVEERELLDAPQSQALRAQDHGGER